MAEHILLSISVLASRKKEQVRRCLDSLHLITERLPCELILVDTSKDASVHEMLLTYSGQVVEFDWCNDFAKARNAGLERAKGEWFLYIDDDEWFEDVEELIAFFESGEYKKFGCANYIQRNYFDQMLINYSDAWASRMIRLREGTCFLSKIHEYLYPQTGLCKNLHVIAGHTGYIFQTDEDKQRHFDRNYPLLLEMMEEEPERLRWRVQIVQEFYAVHRWKELMEFCEESLEFCRNRDDEWDNRDIGTFYAGAAEAAFHQEDYDKVELVGRRMKADRRSSELCHAYLALLRARAYFRQRKWKETKGCVGEFYRKKKYLEKNRLKLEVQQGALLVESAFDSVQMKRALSLEMGCALMRGDTSLLRSQFEGLEWDKQAIYVSDDFFPILIEAMATLPQEEIFVRAMQCLWSNDEMQSRMFAEIQGWESKDQEGFHRLLRIMAQVEAQHWYIWYAKLLVAGMDGNAEHLEEDFQKFCLTTPNVFLTPPNVLEVLQKYRVPAEGAYRMVPFDRWDEHLREYIAKVSLQDLLLKEQELVKMQTEDSSHFRYALMRIAEARVLHSEAQESYQTKRDSIRGFAERASAFARCYYREEIVGEMQELLPEYMRAALLLEQAFAVEGTNVVQAAELQRDAAQVYPSIAPAVRSYMQADSEERLRRQREARTEMRRLEHEIKERVKQCIERKQFGDALAILDQLKQMCPNDLEAAELTLRARLGAIESGV